MKKALIQIYNDLVLKGEIQQDPAQEELIPYLQTLCDQLQQKHNSLWSKVFPQFRAINPIKSLYIYGGVGRGKTFLMDLFFSQVPINRKKRVHFHVFMKELHEKLYKLETQKEIPIFALAQELIEEIDVLCVDEFFVDHIADAMLLSRLFTLLFHRGIVVVSTSNTSMDNLYLNGFQRDLFLPFISTLKDHMTELHLTGKQDHRQNLAKDTNCKFFTPLTVASKAAFKNCYKLIAREEPSPQNLLIQGRVIKAEGVTSKDVWFSFSELCEGARSGEDYIELAQTYKNFFISDVPQMDPFKYNEAKRFMTLIDILYDHHANLWISAETIPSLLYVTGKESESFKRTSSRLLEMQK
jgi:cell division protein ZapE